MDVRLPDFKDLKKEGFHMPKSNNELELTLVQE